MRYLFQETSFTGQHSSVQDSGHLYEHKGGPRTRLDFAERLHMHQGRTVCKAQEQFYEGMTISWEGGGIQTLLTF